MANTGKPTTAKITIAEIRRETELSKLIVMPDGGEHWIPKASIWGWNPATKQMEVNTFMLQGKGIKFKL
jgi:hypothetical protein